jgi:predicted RNA-binding Zn-ribbon protein involved in translation (DUF1610 family)
MTFPINNGPFKAPGVYVDIDCGPIGGDLHIRPGRGIDGDYGGVYIPPVEHGQCLTADLINQIIDAVNTVPVVTRVEVLVCPECGAPIARDTEQCEHCRSHLVVTQGR